MPTKYRKLLVVGLALSLVLFFFTATFAFEKAKFAVVTDTHMALYGVNGMKMGAASTEIVEKTVRELNKVEDLDFVVVTGDLLLDGEPWNLDLMKVYLDDLRVPYYVVCGNHDYAPASQAKAGKAPYVGVNKAAVIWTFQGHGYRGADAWWGADPMPGLHLIGLDSNVPIHWGGHIPLSEMKFLDEELYANRDKVNVVFCHHNFVAWCKDDEFGGKFDKFQVDNAPEVRKIFEKYVPAVQLVLSGHRHIGLRYKTVNGVNYIVNPAAVSYPNQYTLYTLTPHKVSYETKWVPVEWGIIEEAKANLLKAEWWRPTGASDEEMLAFFEGPGDVLKKGEIGLKPVAQGKL
ncbi:MAG: metallophosphoesterase [Deltaproteobacteria bacterium]|nr:metallophosphoesterase [Deltaproteobacteria bacterium]